MGKSKELAELGDAVTVDGSNIGIGTGSPAHPLDVTGTIRSNVSTTGDLNFYATSTGGGSFRIYPDDATTANPTWQHQSNSNEDQAWVIGGVERMRIDSSGNVGINTASPSRQLDIYGANPAMQFTDSDGSYGQIVTGAGTLSIRADEGNTAASSYIRMEVDGSEAMRIDSSGNVVVGRTNVNTFDVVGHGFRSDGVVSHTADSQAIAYLNRETNDGDLVVFRKDNSTVGSIGTNSNGNFQLYGAAASHVGLQFGSPSILPINNSGASSDNAVDLGDGTIRFKDLYLSGGIQFDSRSNKLDDYEEGTWTPTLPSGGSLNVNSAKYIKIGNKVTVTAYVNSVNPTANGTQFKLGGLPFTNVNTPNHYVAGSLGYTGNNNLSDLMPITGVNLNYIYFHENDGPASSATNNTMRSKGITGASADAIILTITYFT